MNDYINRRTLAKLGATFDGDSLSSFEVEYLTTIHSEWVKLDNKEPPKTSKQKRK